MSKRQIVTMKPLELSALLEALRSDSSFLDVNEGGINFHVEKKVYGGVACWYAPQGEITHDLTIIKPGSEYEVHVSWVSPRDREKILKAKTLKGVLGKIKRLN